MCDLCGYGPNESRWKTPPATQERVEEVKEWQRQTILTDGHTITFVETFAYSVGRVLWGFPELLVTGALTPRIAGYMINQVANLEAAGEINVLTLCGPRPVQLDGFGCELRFQRVHAVVCQMYGAVALGGSDVDAVQIIWPDAEGRWPEDAGFAHGRDAQPIYRRDV